MRSKTKNPSVSINFKTPEGLNTCHQLSNKTTVAFELSNSQVDASERGKRQTCIKRGFPGGLVGYSPWYIYCMAGLIRPEWSTIVKGEVIMANLPYWLLIPCLCWLCLYSFPLQPEDLEQIKTTVSNRNTVHQVQPIWFIDLLCETVNNVCGNICEFCCCQPDNSLQCSFRVGLDALSYGESVCNSPKSCWY